MPPFDEANMSDTGLLISVEDLINQAMGPQEMNVINFKIMQMVLHILARQQRLLEQRVEIRITDLAPSRHKFMKERVVEDSESSSSKSPRPKGRMADIKEEHASKKDKALKEKERLEKEKEKAEKLAQKAKEIQEREMERAERAALKEKQKAQKLTLKEQEKLEKLERKEKEKAERQAQKEQEKAEKQSQKEQDKAEKLSHKEKEKAEKLAQKEQDKAEKYGQKEREKAEKLSQKEQDKAEKLAQKEKEKAEKFTQKEQEKEEKLTQKEKEKAEKLAQREQEKTEKVGQKEKDKAEKLSQKEKEKAEKLAQKDKEKIEKAALKEREITEKSPREKKKLAPSDTSIAISEERRGKEKVLVVEKGPTTRPESYSRGSIEVVTQSQFALLESAVRELKDAVAPAMPLKLPDNEKLRSDLARGSASLQDTMRAMQIDARVQAAEQAITRMTGLLLAIAGTEPGELEDLLEEAEKKRATSEAEAGLALKARPSSARKSVIIDPLAKASEASGLARLMSRISTGSMPRPSMSIMRRPSSSRGSTEGVGVTHDEMDESINELREDLIKSMNTMTNRATTAADNALYTAKNVADKLEIALSLDSRLSTLHSLATDYAEQLHGFDAGLATQMQSFREQMVQMRGDLKSGLLLLESVNNNAETAAVTELTERYQDLVTELDATLHTHRSLTKFQTQLANELHSLVECVEMLREQKADRDEVVDGLRDKADTSRLAGLLTESEFATARADLERRLAVCHDKFQRQDNVWMTAIKDLNRITDCKSEIIDLLSARDELQKELQVLHQRLQVLAAVLGEPNAAVVKRKLATGAACAACGAPALMSPRDATKGAPPRLPALHVEHRAAALASALASAKEPCLKDWMPPDMPDDRHVCHRWCGGSHTLVSDSTRRGQAPGPELDATGPPVKRYTGYGSDGRLYMMEEELQPCLECNEVNAKVADDIPLHLGAGDQNMQ